MSKTPCYHCDTDCKNNVIAFDEKEFCCNGCKTVYEILNQNELSCYYDLESTPGSIPKEIQGKYDYLDNADIADKITAFDDGSTTVVNLFIPSIHCSSCIWVLENLEKLNKGIKITQVNFPKKELRITFKNQEITLRQVVELISSIGYEPYISLENSENGNKVADKTIIYQIAVAGFAFGNIMMLSFPEYFDVDELWLNRFKPFFRFLMFSFSVPVVVYAARDYFISAYLGLKKGILNIDVPLSLGILVLFVRSSYEIFTNTGQGYFDSLAGLVFFLLLGKFFQKKTYSYLSFERDYKSYFPIAITKINKDQSHVTIVVNDIKKGDRLLIRNEEIIPADGILINGNALIDYSFVTGESLPVVKQSGDKLYAGGKQTMGAIEMEALETVTQSYLTQLWSNDIFQKNDSRNIRTITDKISKYFTVIILMIALLSGIYWYFHDLSTAFQVVSAVLIIACPCALAMSAPFALGNTLRIFGRHKFYLKNAGVIESMSKIDTLVFDKTGTITSNHNAAIAFEGNALTENESICLKTLLRSSNHPLSRMLFDHLPGQTGDELPASFNEVTGKGMEGKFEGLDFQIGSPGFLGIEDSENLSTHIYIKINGILKGKFVFKNRYRENLKATFDSLSEYKKNILSGDNEGEKAYLSSLLPPGSEILFNQKPENKLLSIKKIQEQGMKVMMFGDGLNDAGALAQSNVGIAVSENINVFSPACDGILDATKFAQLPGFLKMSKKTMSIIVASFIISLLYNTVGMYFAVTAQLSPVIAAILMPLSSISVVTFVTLSTNLISKKILS
ncbi:MAG: heavy metal translocating P-type ATPase metal-binding domain-containing protein [Flavobacteriaceae bacterium]|nr:heavy metal translocating P-type ATPase metal-binding domain-containing protein [Flavobacteriaceae bacterium]